MDCTDLSTQNCTNEVNCHHSLSASDCSPPSEDKPAVSVPIPTSANKTGVTLPITSVAPDFPGQVVQGKYVLLIN